MIDINTRCHLVSTPIHICSSSHICSLLGWVDGVGNSPKEKTSVSNEKACCTVLCQKYLLPIALVGIELEGTGSQGTCSSVSRPGSTGLGLGCQRWCKRGEATLLHWAMLLPWRGCTELWSAQPAPEGGWATVQQAQPMSGERAWA